MPVATAHAYARTRAAAGTVEQAEAEAALAWQREREDPSLQRCWGRDAPLRVLLGDPTNSERAWAPEEPSRLGVYARRVWDPLLAAEELGAR